MRDAHTENKFQAAEKELQELRSNLPAICQEILTVVLVKQWIAMEQFDDARTEAQSLPSDCLDKQSLLYLISEHVREKLLWDNGSKAYTSYR